MVELVYTVDSKSTVARHEGSTPSLSTNPQRANVEVKIDVRLATYCHFYASVSELADDVVSNTIAEKRVVSSPTIRTSQR